MVDHALPGLVGGLGVEVADGVRTAGQPQRERGHVELAGILVDAQTEVEHLLDRDAAGVEEGTGQASDQVGVEALVAGRDRRVDGEHAVAPDLAPGVVEGDPARRTRARARRGGTRSGPR